MTRKNFSDLALCGNENTNEEIIYSPSRGYFSCSLVYEVSLFYFLIFKLLQTIFPAIVAIVNSVDVMDHLHPFFQHYGKNYLISAIDSAYHDGRKTYSTSGAVAR